MGLVQPGPNRVQWRPVKTRLYFVSPATLVEADIRELWMLRLRFMCLRPGIDPQDDYAKFSGDVRAAHTIELLRDETGGLRGMMVFSAHPRTHAGRPFLWLYVDYGFLDPACLQSSIWPRTGPCTGCEASSRVLLPT